MSKKIIVFAFFAVLLSSYVYSNEQGEYYDKFRDRVQERKEIRQENAEERRLRICPHLEERIDIKVDRFAEHKDTHVEKYRHLKERLENALGRLEEKGFDVSQLREDLVALDDLIKEYAQLYADFIESLRFTRGYACGKSEGDFKDALAAAKEKYELVKEKREEIRNYYKDVIREDIKELRQQAEDMDSEEEKNE